MNDDLANALRAKARETGFAGVVRVWNGDEVLVELAEGLADRANERRVTASTRFAIASGTKGLTALTVMAMIEAGELSLDTSVRAVVGDALPHVDPRVSVDHLLSHRSGVGDYVDEEVLTDIDEHVLGAVSAHTLVSPRDYLPLLNRYQQQCVPGTEFAYNNSGYVILSIIIEAIAGSFHDEVAQRVLRPATMLDGGFLRSDDLPPDTACGYLQDGRSNIFHLPVIGAGDGGAYLTLDDASAFWRALASGAIVAPRSVADMMTVTSNRDDKPSYGRGFWLGDAGDHVWLEGMDAGVSFMTGRRNSTGLHYTLMSNTSSGVWPLAEVIRARQG